MANVLLIEIFIRAKSADCHPSNNSQNNIMYVSIGSNSVRHISLQWFVQGQGPPGRRGGHRRLLPPELPPLPVHLPKGKIIKSMAKTSIKLKWYLKGRVWVHHWGGGGCQWGYRSGDSWGRGEGLRMSVDVYGIDGLDSLVHTEWTWCTLYE